MSTVRIAKEFRWEMGHRLPFHEGLCKNIHGHSYRLTVEIEGLLDVNGMVLDYYDMKRIVQPIVDEFDHCFLCDESDAIMREFFSAHPMKAVFVPFSTTAENIAGHIAKRLVPEFSAFANISGLTLRLYETAGAYAEVSVNIGK